MIVSSNIITPDIDDVAVALATKGKGLLAADESVATIGKRFAPIKLDNNSLNRRAYREMLLGAEEAISSSISGVIMFDETIKDKTSDGVSFVDVVSSAGALVGIKVDKGAKPLAGFAGETITEGLDNLRESLNQYYELGARFAKWRATIVIGDGQPSEFAVKINALALARYAALCQEAKIVPIVEPEVLMDGDHDINRCAEVTQAVLTELYYYLNQHKVRLEASILKPNMVIPGKKCPQQASSEQIAEMTVQILRRCVPAAVPGIAFLSGGQSELEATANLNAMNAAYDVPWQLTFSYGRALQASAINAWSGDEANVAAARSVFAHRAHMNSLATRGQWSKAREDSVV